MVEPSGSRAAEKGTGSCDVGAVVSMVHQAMLCEEPHAARLILYSSKPVTSAGLRLTDVDVFPCCPWSLSPQAYTYRICIHVKEK